MPQMMFLFCSVTEGLSEGNLCGILRMEICENAAGGLWKWLWAKDKVTTWERPIEVRHNAHFPRVASSCSALLVDARLRDEKDTGMGY